MWSLWLPRCWSVHRDGLVLVARLSAGTSASPLNPAPTSGGPRGLRLLRNPGILLVVLGVLNIIWGIGAISDAKFFVAGQKYIIGSLHSWGWITLILGVIELFAGLSLFSGGGFGRWVGIFAAALTSISALLSIPAYPFWSLAVFALSIINLYELATAPQRRTTT